MIHRFRCRPGLVVCRRNSLVIELQIRLMVAVALTATVEQRAELERTAGWTRMRCGAGVLGSSPKESLVLARSPRGEGASPVCLSAPSKRFKVSNDPRFEEKLVDVVGM